MGAAEAARQAIVDPARLGDAAIRAGDDDAEGRFAGSEIARAIDGIDNPAGPVEPLEDRRVRMRGLFPNERERGIDRGQAFAQQRLAVLVGNRHRVVAALVLDFARCEIAIARQDGAFGNPAHEIEDLVVERGHER